MKLHTNHTAQRGTALVIALVLLAAVTLLAVAAVNTSVMEMRMANSDEMRMQAFQAADSAVDFVIDDFEALQDAMGIRNQYCVNTTGTTFTDCDETTDRLQNKLVYESDDKLDVRISKLGECLPPPRVKSASSVTEFTRFDYIIESRIDRTEKGGGNAHIWRGYMVLAPGGGC